MKNKEKPEKKSIRKNKPKWQKSKKGECYRKIKLGRFKNSN